MWMSDGGGILAPNEPHWGLSPSGALSRLIRWMKHQQVEAQLPEAPEGGVSDTHFC